MGKAEFNLAPRDPATVGRIDVDPAVLRGKPRIAGTRISVELVLEELSAGMRIEDLLAGYPHLTREDVQAALGYALRAVRHEELRPLPDAGAAG